MGTSCTTGEQQKRTKPTLSPAPQAQTNLPVSNLEQPDRSGQNLDISHPRPVVPSLHYPSIKSIIPGKYYEDSHSSPISKPEQNNRKSSLIQKSQQKQHSAIIRSGKSRLSNQHQPIINEENTQNSKTFSSVSKKQESKLNSRISSKAAHQIQSDTQSNLKKKEREEASQKKDSQIFQQQQDLYSFNIKAPCNQSPNPQAQLIQKTNTSKLEIKNSSSGLKNQTTEFSPIYYSNNTTINIKTDLDQVSTSKAFHPHKSIKGLTSSKLNEDFVPLDSVVCYGPQAGTHQFKFDVDLEVK